MPPALRRLATFAWQTPTPTSVDEELSIFDDGSAWLVVRGPRTATAAIGTYRGQPAKADYRALSAAGPGTVRFNLLKPPAAGADARLMAAADRVAAAALKRPDAVATFSVQALDSPASGTLALSLAVVASGVRPVEFRLDPGASSVVFGHAGQTVSWSDLPGLAAGFVSPDADELGGVRRTARIEPGAYGAIAFDLPAAAGASEVLARLAGWLSSGLPDEDGPGRFNVSTDEAPVHA